MDDIHLCIPNRFDNLYYVKDGINIFKFNAQQKEF